MRTRHGYRQGAQLRLGPMNAQVSVPDRLTVTYQVAPVSGSSPERFARTVALEQTVELPEGTYPESVEREVVARVEQAVVADDGRWQFALSYPADLAGTEVPQFLNVLFGNVSLFPGVTVTAAELPDATVKAFGGPRRGLHGFREATGVHGRPLVCSAAKPVGLSPGDLAARCRALALGGIDIIKDDHGVMNQRYARFDDRLTRLQDAVHDANTVTGGRTLYFPNITGPIDQLHDRAVRARELGCSGVLLNPFLAGLDTIRWVADDTGLLVLSHPTFAGVASGQGSGLAPELLYGQLLRVFGADGVVFIASGGRFPVPDEVVDAIVAGQRSPSLPARPALPVLGGGIDVTSVTAWTDRLGSDLMFLIGSSLYQSGDLTGAARRLMDEVTRLGDSA
jgi:ribulose-bisphosphate carboxylase large chain